MIFLKKYDKAENVYEEKEIKNQITTLENFYVNAQLDNLPQLVEEQKNNIVNQIIEFKEKRMTLYDSDTGEITQEGVRMTPFVISNYFFRSINNLQNIEPQYSGEHLSILWNLYLYMVEQVNLNLCEFTPNISHFCKFIGITTTGLKKMLKSSDEGIRIVVEKIYDACYDEQMTMAEHGKYNARATTFRMKSEMNIVEKEAPQVVVNVNATNYDDVNKRLNELLGFDKRVTEAEYELKK